MAAKVPSTIEEGQQQVKELGSAAQKLEVELAIAKRELHQALTREKPTQSSRGVLSMAHYVTKGELKNSRKAVPEPEPKKRKSKAKEAPQPSKRARRVRDEDVVEVGDSEAEREVNRLMHLDEEGVVQERRRTLYKVGLEDT